MTAKIIIDKDKLYDLYINQNKSVEEVSIILNNTIRSIRKNLRRYNIKKNINLITIKRKEFCLKKYGVEYYAQTEECKIKSKNTSKHKYGVDHYSKTKDFQEHVKQTNIKKFNVDYYSKTIECKNKMKQTCLTKYGIEYFSKTQEFKNKFKQTCLDKYGVENYRQTKECSEKIKKTNISRYGEENFLKSKQGKDKCKKTCIAKYGVEFSQQKHIKNFELWNNKEKLKEFIKQSDNKSSRFLCNFFNVYTSTIIEDAHKNNYFDLLDIKISSYELEIYELFKELNPIKQDKKILEGFELDLYFPQFKTAIEFNGDYWHGEKYKTNNYHQKKSLLAEEKGIFIYHIWQNEWDNNKDRIINQLKNLFHLNKEKIYARKCKINIVSPKESREFLEQNHIQGSTNAKIHLGLYYNNELVSLMLFGKPIRQNIKYDWELKRFCSKANTNVTGAASKLFKYFIRNYQGTIISYSDIAKTQGNLYKVLGFTLDHITVPNYKYCDSHSHILLKISCKKSNLKKLGFDTDNKTESEIMNERGYWKIFDSGLKVWTYTR